MDQRDLLVNFERMRREMDELFGDAVGRAGWRARRGASPASRPRVDVYYCGATSRAAVVKAELAGVDSDAVSLEVCGRELVISGERPVQETEGRVYQQVEIPAGPFRRVVELSADVVAERAQATYEDGVLRVELPLRAARQVDDAGCPIEREPSEVAMARALDRGRRRRRLEDASAREGQPLPAALPVLPLRTWSPSRTR